MRYFLIAAALLCLSGCARAEERPDLGLDYVADDETMAGAPASQIEAIGPLEDADYDPKPKDAAEALRFEICREINLGLPCSIEDVAEYVQFLREEGSSFASLFCEPYAGSREESAMLLSIIFFNPQAPWAEAMDRSEVPYLRFPVALQHKMRKCRIA